MNVRRKVLLWYTLFVTVVIAGLTAAGTVVVVNTLNSGNLSPAAVWFASAAGFSVVILAAVIGSKIVSQRYIAPLRRLQKVTEEAGGLGISSTFPSLRKRDSDPVSSSVASIYDFMKQQHEKLQQVLHFSSLTSHELRTPLTIIRNQLEDALQADVTHDYLRNIVASTYDEVIRLHHLVNDLLTISTLQAGTMKLEKSEIQFHVFVKEFYDEALFLSREKDISIVLPRGPQAVIYCDEMRLRQVLFNLFDNALKFTPKKGKIHISYRIVDDKLELKISDTGTGVPHHQLDKIFEPFYQVSRYDQEVHQGAGLGLSLVRWIIEAHDGSIDVESEVGKGTTFTIQLPLTESSSD
jgi:signal transduction histidine kinase